MTPSARIQATLELLQEVAGKLRPADALVSAYFRTRRFIGSHDRADISTRVYSVLRHRARLDWWLDNFCANLQSRHSGKLSFAKRKKVFRNDEVGIRTRLIAWLALGEKHSAKDIDALFTGGKFAPDPLDDAERAFLRKIEGCTIEHPNMPEEVLAECPLDSVAALKQKFGKNFMREMRAMQKPATLDLRINPLKTTREEILLALQELGFEVKPCALSPWGVRVFERPNLSALPMLKNGLVEIQDEGSQMVALALDAKPGERIVVEGQLRVRPGAAVQPQPYDDRKPGN